MIYIVRHTKRTQHLTPQGESILSHYRYIGRPTVLGNPFTHLKTPNNAMFIVPTIEEAVDRYRHWFYQQLFIDREFQKVVNDLVDEYRHTRLLYLGCWCMDEINPSTKDHLCHAMVVREYIQNAERALNYFNMIKNEILK